MFFLCNSLPKVLGHLTFISKGTPGCAEDCCFTACLILPCRSPVDVAQFPLLAAADSQHPSHPPPPPPFTALAKAPLSFNPATARPAPSQKNLLSHWTPLSSPLLVSPRLASVSLSDSPSSLRPAFEKQQVQSGVQRAGCLVGTVSKLASDCYWSPRPHPDRSFTPSLDTRSPLFAVQLTLHLFNLRPPPIKSLLAMSFTLAVQFPHIHQTLSVFIRIKALFD